MAQEIYHRSNWGNPTEQWGNVYLNADLTNELYKRASEYENSWVTDQLLNGVGTKPSIILTPTAYEDGVLNSVKPQRTFGSELVTPTDSTSNWINARGNSTLSVVGGKIRATITSGTTFGVSTAISTVIGKTYSIKSDGFKSNTNGNFLIRVSNVAGLSPAFYEEASSNSQTISTNGTFVATATTTYVGLLATLQTVGDYIETGNVSVKEVTEADFDFTRGSSATRVNEQGLVQDVQLLSGELVQNGDFEQIGSELVTNGGFDTDTGWTKGTGWSIANGSLNGVNATSSTYQNNGLVSGKFYKVVYEVSNYSSGTVQIKLGGTLGEARNENGTYTEYIKASQVITWIVGTNFTGSIDNVSVKEVGQNWTFGTGWSMGDGVAVFDTTSNSSFITNLNISSGNLYRLKIEGEVTIGNIKLSATSGLGNDQTISLPFEQEITHDGGANTVEIRTIGSAEGFISNVSVIEITDDTDLPRINYTNFDYEDVLGDELLNYNNFTYGSGGWSLVGSKWVFDDVTSGYLVIDNFDVEVGQKYQVTVNISISSGDANFRITSGNGQTQLFNYTDFADGETTFETTVTGVDGTIQRLFAVTSLTDNPFTLNSISVKRLTEDVVVPYSGEGSLLLEPQSTNLITYSEDFSDSSWNLDFAANYITRTPNAATSPSGENNATKLIGNDTSKIPTNAYIGASTSASAPYTSSIFAKKGEYDYLLLGIGTYAGGYYAIFNLSNGTISTLPTASGTTASIEDYGNGWYRCIIATTNTSGSEILFTTPLVDGTITTNYTNTTNGVYVWGAQLEELSYATSYIPTNGSTVTRLADVCNNSGSSDLINSTEGVLYAEISALANDGTDRVITISDGSTSNRVTIYYATTNNQIGWAIISNNSATAFNTHSINNSLSINKFALKYKQDDFQFWINGEQVGTDTSGSTPTGLDELAFYRGGGTLPFYGNVKSVAVFKEALSDEELQKLTTI